MIKALGRVLEGLAIALLIGAIRVYQFTLSPLLGPACRFEPTCSRYMIEAVRKYGLIQGFWKGLVRFLTVIPGILADSIHPESREDPGPGYSRSRPA